MGNHDVQMLFIDPAHFPYKDHGPPNGGLCVQLIQRLSAKSRAMHYSCDPGFCAAVQVHDFGHALYVARVTCQGLKPFCFFPNGLLR